MVDLNEALVERGIVMDDFAQHSIKVTALFPKGLGFFYAGTEFI